MDSLTPTHHKYYDSFSSYSRSILSIKPKEIPKISTCSSEESIKKDRVFSVHNSSMITIYPLYSIKIDKKNKEIVSLNQCACTVF